MSNRDKIIAVLHSHALATDEQCADAILAKLAECAEPVYQTQHGIDGGLWRDNTQNQYKYNSNFPTNTCRVLYTTPTDAQAQIDALRAERDKLIQAVADHVTVRAEQCAELAKGEARIEAIRWPLIYAHNALEFIRLMHPNIYAECGDDDTLRKEREAAIAQETEPNNEHVICPNCTTQFRAIPVQVQSLLLAAGYEPPFLGKPAPLKVPSRDMLSTVNELLLALGFVPVRTPSKNDVIQAVNIIHDFAHSIAAIARAEAFGYPGPDSCDMSPEERADNLKGEEK